MDAYHNSNDDSQIFIFERGVSKFISSAPKLLAANEAFLDQTEEDKKIIANFGISKARLKQQYINELKEVRLELTAKLGTDPAQLRKIAEFKKIESQYDGYKIGIATKKAEPDLFEAYKLKPGKRVGKELKKINTLEIRDTLGEV